MKRRSSTGGQLSDLAFLLIMFFMVLAGSMTLGLITAELPAEAESAAAGDAAGEILQVNVLPGGIWLYGDTEVDRIGLADLLSDAAQKRTAVLTMLIDGEASWQEVTSTLTLAEQAGITTISMELMK